MTVWEWLRALAVELPEGSGFRVQGSGCRVQANRRSRLELLRDSLAVVARTSGRAAGGFRYQAFGRLELVDWRRCATAVELPELSKTL